MRAPFLIAAVALAGGCTERVPATQVMVAVWSDLPASDLKRVTVTVERSIDHGGTTVAEVKCVCVGSGPGCHPLPLTLALAAESEQKIDGAFTVRVSGYREGSCKDADFLAEQSATIRFVKRQALRLELYLLQECRGKKCEPGTTCFHRMACEDDQRKELPPLDTDAGVPSPDLAAPLPDLGPADLATPDLVDCDASCKPYFLDGDGDGIGVALASRCLCEPLKPYTATAVGDCDDGDPVVTTCPAAITEELSALGNVNFAGIAAKYAAVSGGAEHARWKVIPAGEWPPKTMTFYAALTTTADAPPLLSVYTTDANKDAMRAFLPGLPTYKDQWGVSIYDSWFTSTGADWSRVYSPSETLLRRILTEASAQLVKDALVGPGAVPRGRFVYASGFLSGAWIAHKYMAGNHFGHTYEAGNHHWPSGDANTQCGYEKSFYACTSTYGTHEKFYTLAPVNPRYAVLFTYAYCDNGEQSRVDVDGVPWASQVSFGYKLAEKSFDAAFPSQIHLWSKMTWSGVNASFYYAVDADDLKVTTMNEPADVLQRLEMGTVYLRPRLSLKVSGITLSPPMVKAGDAVTISALISNLGDFDATAVPVSFLVDGAPAAKRFLGTVPATVPAGGSTKINLPWTAVSGVRNLGVIDAFNNWGIANLPVTVN